MTREKRNKKRWANVWECFQQQKCPPASLSYSSSPAPFMCPLEPATCPCATALFGGIAGLFDHGISHNPGRLRVGPGKTQDHSGPLEPPKAGVATTASKATLHEAPTKHGHTHHTRAPTPPAWPTAANPGHSSNAITSVTKQTKQRQGAPRARS